MKKIIGNKYWQVYEKKWTDIYYSWDCEVVDLLWKQVQKAFKKLKINPLSDTYITLFDIWPKYWISHCIDLCSTTFIVTLFTATKKWKQPKSHSTHKWITKTLFINNVKYSLSVNKNKIMNFEGKWMELDYITMRVVMQTQAWKFCMLSLILGSTGLIWITCYS